MDNYSHPKFKVAATKPEHIVRKLEFDLAIALFEKRVTAIEKTLDVSPSATGSVLNGHPGIETAQIADDLGISFPISLSDTAGIADETVFIKTSPLLGYTESETIGLDDDTLIPHPIFLSDTAGIADEVQHIQSLPLTATLPVDSLSISDTFKTMVPKGTNMENLSMQGEIEVVLEDKNGNVKKREIITNTMTEAFERYTFYDMLNCGTLSALLRSHTRSGFNFLSRTLPATFGVYALSHDIDIRKNTYLPPYVHHDLVSLAPDVSFYNVGGSATESTKEMIPVDQRCFFDKTKKEFVFEYVKNTGVGTVKSVCVGRSHSLKTGLFSVALSEHSVPSTWQAGTANYLLEHTTGGTFLWKTAGSSGPSYRNHLMTRSTETFTGTPCSSAISGSNTVGGLVVGDVIFKAAKQSAADQIYVVRLTYINNFQTSATAVTKDITFTCREGMTVDSSVTPVLVVKPNANKLEIFVTLSIGDHDGVFGCNIQKAVLGNLSDPANLSIAIEDVGVIPYAISNWTSTAVGYYLTGFYDDGKYFLPYYSVMDEDGNISIAAEAAHQAGIVISDDFTTVLSTVNFRSATANEVNAFVRTDDTIVQCRVNSPAIPYIHMSQILSGSNLPNAVTKSVDDVLRIIYRYRLL